MVIYPYAVVMNDGFITFTETLYHLLFKTDDLNSWTIVYEVVSAVDNEHNPPNGSAVVFLQVVIS